jgi:integrase
VTLTPALTAILREQFERVSLDGQVNEWTPEQRAWMFPNRNGQTRQHAPFTEVWKRLLRKAGLPHRKYHATRHTFATSRLENKADIRWVQQQMGHASISQTADTYGHVQPERHESAAARLDAYLGVSAQ